MQQLVLSTKAAKLMKLCEAEGFCTFDGLLLARGTDSVCPAICMTEGCDHVAEAAESGERGGFRAHGFAESLHFDYAACDEHGGGACAVVESV